MDDTDPTLPESVTALLRAVLDALDIPFPATIGDGEMHDKILNDRVMHAVIALRSVLGDGAACDLEWTTAYLRERLATVPPAGYRVYGTPHTPSLCTPSERGEQCMAVDHPDMPQLYNCRCFRGGPTCPRPGKADQGGDRS